jgi:DNA-binding protein H-NS
MPDKTNHVIDVLEQALQTARHELSKRQSDLREAQKMVAYYEERIADLDAALAAQLSSKEEADHHADEQDSPERDTD